MSKLLVRRESAKSIVIALGIVLGVAVGFGGATLAFATADDDSPSSTQKATEWPTNAEGLTYGSALDAVSAEDEPDLILAVATNGNVGYVLATDLDGEEPQTPEEAIAQQAANAGKSRTIPVCEADGTTVIGHFVISPGRVTLQE